MTFDSRDLAQMDAYDDRRTALLAAATLFNGEVALHSYGLDDDDLRGIFIVADQLVKWLGS